MKSTLKVTEEIKENKYPVLKVNYIKTIIVLFTEPDWGFVINSLDEDYPIGCNCNEWNESEFTNYNGTVTLENK